MQAHYRRVAAQLQMQRPNTAAVSAAQAQQEEAMYAAAEREALLRQSRGWSTTQIAVGVLGALTLSGLLYFVVRHKIFPPPHRIVAR